MNILIVEDNPNDELLMEIQLRKSYNPLIVFCAQTKREFFEAISHDWDIILSDYVLVDFDALDALRTLQEQNIKTPLIVVTGAVRGDKVIEACKQAGAKGFLLKDELYRLIPTIEEVLTLHAESTANEH